MLFRSIPHREISPDEAALGKELLSLISWAVHEGLDPEVALRKAALEFRDDMTRQEAR